MCDIIKFVNEDGNEVEPWMDWRFYRNTYQDYSGEYEAADSWTATRTVCRAAGSHYRGSQDIVMVVSIHGRRDYRHKLRAVSWSASLTCRHVCFSVSSGKCKSVRDAQRRADDALAESTAIKDLLGVLYCPSRARCVYRYDRTLRDEHPDDPSKWFRPFCTLLRGGNNGDFLGTIGQYGHRRHHLGYTKYYVKVGVYRNETRHTLVSDFSCGYAEGPLVGHKKDDLPHVDPAWFPDWLADARVADDAPSMISS